MFLFLVVRHRLRKLMAAPKLCGGTRGVFRCARLRAIVSLPSGVLRDSRKTSPSQSSPPRRSSLFKRPLRTYTDPAMLHREGRRALGSCANARSTSALSTSIRPSEPSSPWSLVPGASRPIHYDVVDWGLEGSFRLPARCSLWGWALELANLLY
uniref:Uncharacterized protein n=1 Tax=Steinernema glaseri TaxID=37863 RepID=A0A1I7YEV9_9BILA